MATEQTHRFILMPYGGGRGTRIRCPYCNSEKEFSPYIDTETGEVINEYVGRCNKENKCGQHYTPSQYFADNPNERKRFFDEDTEREYRPAEQRRYTPPANDTPPTYIERGMFERSLSAYQYNNFYSFLSAKFTPEIAAAKASEYNIGTSKHWGKDSTVFWQVDNNGNVRSGKIMLYDKATGKRVKDSFNYVTWVHKALKLAEYNLKQCLFGLHLINRPENAEKIICIVESEKTAIIASIYMPEYVWMANGSKTHLNEALFEPLKGREVHFYPDLGGYGEWVERTDKLKHLITVKVDDTIQQIATEDEIKQGLDIADYLLRRDYNKIDLMAAFVDELIQHGNTADLNQMVGKYLKSGLGLDEIREAVAVAKKNYKDKAA